MCGYRAVRVLGNTWFKAGAAHGADASFAVTPTFAMSTSATGILPRSTRSKWRRSQLVIKGNLKHRRRRKSTVPEVRLGERTCQGTHPAMRVFTPTGTRAEEHRLIGLRHPTTPVLPFVAAPCLVWDGVRLIHLAIRPCCHIHAPLRTSRGSTTNRAMLVQIVLRCNSEYT